MYAFLLLSFFFFFNDTATTEIYTLSLHDALPICGAAARRGPGVCGCRPARGAPRGAASVPAHPARGARDRKSTRLNSSHLVISYAVFCLKKKKKTQDKKSRNRNLHHILRATMMQL